MSQKFLSEVTLQALNNATTDTDRFLVSDSGTVKYRTGSQLLSDLGVSGIYVPYTGATGNVDLGTHTLSSYNLIVNHTSGSGVAASITKGGNGEALTINKTSGSGNAMSVTGGLTSLVDLTLSSIPNATIDTDRFLVSDSGAIKYRTGAQVLSDIGAQAALTNPVTGTGTTNYVTKFTGTSTVGNSQMFDNGTNVGLGTTTPTAIGANIRTLDVKGAGGGGIRSGVFGSSESTFYTIAAGGYLGTISNIPLNFQTNNSVKATILANGNVGIGTTSPSYILDLLSSNPRLRVKDNSTGYSIIDLEGGAGSFYVANDNSTGSGFGGAPYAGTLYRAGAYPIAMWTNASERMRITSTGEVLIGTTTGGGTTYGSTPQLTVASSTGGVLDVRSLSTNILSGDVIGRIQFTGKDDASVGYTTAVIQALAGAGLGTGSGPGTLQFMTSPGGGGSSPAERMRITSSGNVGIGTSSPLMKLDIYGTSGLPATSGTTPVGSLRLNASNNAVLDFGSDNGTASGWIQSTDKSDLSQFYGLLLNPRGGNVGIGTTSIASSRFTVAGGALPTQDNGATSALQFSGGVTGRRASSNNVGFIGTYSNASSIEISAGLSGAGLSMHGFSASANANSFICYTNNTERMRITSAGSVLIGTSTPPASGVKFLVYEPSTPTIVAYFQNNNATCYTGYHSSGTSLNAVRIGASGNNLIFSVTPDGSPLERMRITSSGNVGIGTTSPGNKLSVVTGTGADDTIPALGSNGGKFSLLNNGGLYGLISGVLGSGNSFLQTQRVDGTATAYNMLLQPNGGNVGIGTTTPGYPLQVATQVSNISIYADYDIVAYSDQSVKENIRPIENALERVIKSRGVLYDRIDSDEKNNIGFIAQELEIEFPELVVTNENGTKAVKYQNTVAVLFEAIKEQQKQIEELKQIVNGLTN
jgi:hypothetical protein